MKIQLSDTESINIPIGELAADIWEYSKYLRSNFDAADLTEPGCDDAGGDIRLQACDGSWQTHYGDSQYDRDHSGFWGCGSVPYRCTRKQAVEIAYDLIGDL